MNKCIFCEIIKGNQSAKKIFENKNILSFYDINPCAEKHALIIPKKHITNLNYLSENDKELIIEINLSISKIAKIIGIYEGFKTIINTGKNGGQKIFHLHYHIIGGKLKDISYF